MSENIIYVYSGTGNCLDMAKNIAKGIGGADIVSIRKAPAVTDATGYKRVGFVFPCHGGGAPADVLEHAKLVRVSPDAYTFGVSQSASYPGTGLAELDKIVHLDYWKAAIHQCTCIWLFPHNMMVPPVGAKQAQKRSEKKAAKIAADILAGVKTEKRPPRNVLNAAENKAWPVITKKKAKGFKVSDACISCGQCARLCPRENIRMEAGRPIFGTNCIQCLGCLQYCPKEAISLGKITDKREHYHNVNISAVELMKDVIRVD